MFLARKTKGRVTWKPSTRERSVPVVYRWLWPLSLAGVVAPVLLLLRARKGKESKETDGELLVDMP